MSTSTWGVILLILVSSCNLQERLPLSQHFEIIKIETGIYAAIHKLGGKAICNMGIVDLGEKTLLFDSFLSPRVTQELVEALKKMGMPDIGYVVNSHYHNDHIRGNQVFSDQVEIISSDITAELMRSTEPTNLVRERKTAPNDLAHYDSLYQNYEGDTATVEYRDINMWRPYFQVLVEENKSIKPTLPDRTVSESITIKGKAFHVELVSTSKGHSQGDLYLHIPEVGVVFAGDLMFKDTHPFLGAGDLEAWRETLQKIKSLEPKSILPGHGPLAGLKDVDQLLGYMQEIQNFVAQNIPPEQLIIPSEYSTWLLAKFFALNIQLLNERNHSPNK